jgi:hypothetical protein
MSEERVTALREFIFSELEAVGLTVDDDFKKQMFQSPATIRLRYFGYMILKQYYEHESFDLDERLTGTELFTLRDKVGWPYFLPVNHSHVVLFTIKASFVLKLNGGDVKKWLKNLENKTS